MRRIPHRLILKHILFIVYTVPRDARHRDHHTLFSGWRLDTDVLVEVVDQNGEEDGLTEGWGGDCLQAGWGGFCGGEGEGEEGQE